MHQNAMLENAQLAAAVAKGPLNPGGSSCYAKTGAAQTGHRDNAMRRVGIAHKKYRTVGTSSCC